MFVGEIPFAIVLSMRKSGLTNSSRCWVAGADIQEAMESLPEFFLKNISSFKKNPPLSSIKIVN